MAWAAVQLCTAPAWWRRLATPVTTTATAIAASATPATTSPLRLGGRGAGSSEGMASVRIGGLLRFCGRRSGSGRRGLAGRLGVHEAEDHRHEDQGGEGGEHQP